MRAMAEQIKPKDARAAVASQELFVLDVRDDEDWNSNSERIPGSVHIAAEELDSRLDDLPDDRKILVVCPDGERSAEIAEKIDGDDGREAVSLDGGVEKWRSDSLMTQPSPDAAPPKGEDEPPVEEPEDDEEEGEDEATAEAAEPGDGDESDDPGEAEGADPQAAEDSDR
jgi:rhodanese-related sulfurtransferase